MKKTDTDEHTLTQIKAILQIKICFCCSRDQNKSSQATSWYFPLLLCRTSWISQVELNLVETHSPVRAYSETYTRHLCTQSASYTQTHSETVCYPSPCIWLYLGHGSPESSSIIKLKIRNSTGLLILGKAVAPLLLDMHAQSRAVRHFFVCF